MNKWGRVYLMDLLGKAVGFPQNELQAGPWGQGSWGAQCRASRLTVLHINTNSEQRFLAICPFISPGPKPAVGSYWTTVALVYRQLSVWEENQSVKAQRKIPPKWTFLNIPEHPDHRFPGKPSLGEGAPACLRLVSAEPATVGGWA